MEKELSEMSLAELWELFPIFLVAPSGRWRSCYAGMEAVLSDTLAECRVVRISHIGSTAVTGIWSKDIVDILVEVAADSDMTEAARAIERCGFICMSTSADRMSFNRGYTKRGFAADVFHLHLRRAGDNGELYFRDYLNDHPSTAKEYEAMKLRLWKRFGHDRDAYTEAKSEFVRRWTAEARRIYAGRY